MHHIFTINCKVSLVEEFHDLYCSHGDRLSQYNYKNNSKEIKSAKKNLEDPICIVISLNMFPVIQYLILIP